MKSEQTCPSPHLDKKVYIIYIAYMRHVFPYCKVYIYLYVYECMRMHEKRRERTKGKENRRQKRHTDTHTSFIHRV
ncbi:hypothetical protein CSUI_008304 [Cystoisospora suis]|uniref:Uncharacterized protein n=1 Tax=Cystoisospora suis TaxID=483139 RepID=A0A2C6KN21_9APIC|nr:hypothetical protein CSUI_008304 [Cystoisospora suis]